jgi:hypothetical protein
MRNHSAFYLSTFFFCLFAYSSIAQASFPKVKAEHNALYTEYFDLGPNGLAIMGNDNAYASGISSKDAGRNSSSHVMRIDTTGKLAWEKTIQFTGGKNYTHYGACSYDGSDIYILTFKDFKSSTGGQGLIITHINSATGEVRQKADETKNLGHVIELYATKDYFFVITTATGGGICQKSAGCEFFLYRFSKTDLSLQKMDSDFKKDLEANYTFWQIIHVTADYAEGYIVKKIEGAQITLELARFDNEGKMTWSATTDITLTASFPRPGNGPMNLAPGVSRGRDKLNMVQGESSAIMTGMSWCYLMYDLRTQTYFAYGICGQKEFKNMSSNNTGFFIASYNKDFKQLQFKEYGMVPELKSNKLFYDPNQPGAVSIQGYFAPGKNIVMSVSSFSGGTSFLISESDLAKKTQPYSIDIGLYIAPETGLTPDKTGETLAKFDRYSPENDYTSSITTLYRQYMIIVHRKDEHRLVIVTAPIKQ